MMAEQAGRIVHGIWDAGSSWLTQISEHMRGGPSGNYKAVQRFLAQTDAVSALA